MWDFYFQALTAFICSCSYQNTFINLRKYLKSGNANVAEI